MHEEDLDAVVALPGHDSAGGDYQLGCLRGNAGIGSRPACPPQSERLETEV